jgi:uncharacterized protein (DUF1330 family)
VGALYIVFVEKPASEEAIATYRQLALPTLKGKDVKFHSRPGCALQTVEGDDVDVAVVIEFKSVQDAKDWYFSPEYQSAMKHRIETAKSRAVIVETLS